MHLLVVVGLEGAQLVSRVSQGLRQLLLHLLLLVFHLFLKRTVHLSRHIVILHSAEPVLLSLFILPVLLLSAPVCLLLLPVRPLSLLVQFEFVLYFESTQLPVLDQEVLFLLTPEHSLSLLYFLVQLLDDSLVLLSRQLHFTHTLLLLSEVLLTPLLTLLFHLLQLFLLLLDSHLLRFHLGPLSLSLLDAFLVPKTTLVLECLHFPDLLLQGDLMFDTLFGESVLESVVGHALCLQLHLQLVHLNLFLLQLVISLVVLRLDVLQLQVVPLYLDLQTLPFSPPLLFLSLLTLHLLP